MHYYSFADGPARSSIVNFIWRLNVPNSNAAPWYFSLTRTLFTAISPIKSVVDVNVKSAALSRSANSSGEISFRTSLSLEREKKREREEAKKREIRQIRCTSAKVDLRIGNSIA